MWAWWGRASSGRWAWRRGGLTAAQELMEWRHMLITKEQNTAGRGYGKAGRTEDPLLAVWARFYDQPKDECALSPSSSSVTVQEGRGVLPVVRGGPGRSAKVRSSAIGPRLYGSICILG